MEVPTYLYQLVININASVALNNECISISIV
jgi:hypothetical protein